MESKELSFQEFEMAFNTAWGIDDLHASIILDVYEQIKYPLFVSFRSSLENGIFPNLLKIAKVPLIVKFVNALMLVITDQSWLYWYSQKY